MDGTNQTRLHFGARAWWWRLRGRGEAREVEKSRAKQGEQGVLEYGEEVSRRVLVAAGTSNQTRLNFGTRTWWRKVGVGCVFDVWRLAFLFFGDPIWDEVAMASAMPDG